ncbi:MAG: hypothetical protein OEV99_14925 [Nitrospira sp.]|nr:hypothetical protein [Nitrospira sp.]MDH4371114.1 hypothetical protein [Nitrospira sp.]MDH5348305.1 hypothetical protein [Nitrospira sp.]MDH5498369.1 hypothetical protein [Nitrospira sp.]MDH5726258.1 hypothetical protein [Nitrospira sp.]
MTPTEAAAALFKTMPQPITSSQLEEYGVETSDSTAQHIAREILSLNLYWVLAAIDAHIPLKYRAALKEQLFESIQKAWWESGQLGQGTWGEHQPELNERCEHYARLVDQEGISHMGICAETASLMEDRGITSSEDRSKLLVLLIDYAPASEYGRILDKAV